MTPCEILNWVVISSEKNWWFTTRRFDQYALIFFIKMSDTIREAIEIFKQNTVPPRHRVLHQWYLATASTDWVIHPPSPMLITDWFSSVSTHSALPHSKDPSPTSFPPARFIALILQHPVFMRSSSSLLKQQYLPESSFSPEDDQSILIETLSCNHQFFSLLLNWEFPMEEFAAHFVVLDFHFLPHWLLTPSLRRPCIHKIFLLTACRTACKHAFRFLRVFPEAVSTRHSWLWQTLDDVYTRRCFAESEGTRSVPPDKRHCCQWMSSLFCGFLPNPFIDDLFCWSSRHKFVRRIYNPLSLMPLRNSVCSTGCGLIIGRCFGACNGTSCAEERRPQ